MKVGVPYDHDTYGYDTSKRNPTTSFANSQIVRYLYYKYY